MPYTIKKSADGNSVTISDTGQNREFIRGQNSLTVDTDSSSAIPTVDIYSGIRRLVSAAPVSTITNGDTGSVFASLADLKTYVGSGFFRKASGDAGIAIADYGKVHVQPNGDSIFYGFTASVPANFRMATLLPAYLPAGTIFTDFSGNGRKVADLDASFSGAQSAFTSAANSIALNRIVVSAIAINDIVNVASPNAASIAAAMEVAIRKFTRNGM